MNLLLGINVNYFLDINKFIFCVCYIDFKSIIYNNFFLYINVYGIGIYKCLLNLKKKKDDV